MIRLWISRRSALPIREQLSAQLLLGILSRKLPPGEKLPSVRDLARRLKIQGNTVLAVYRDLAERGWVQAQPGSGVFVRRLRWPASAGGVDELVSGWMQEALARGHSLEEVEAAWQRLSRPAMAQTLTVVDSDGELARILAAELTAAIGQTVTSASCAEAKLGLPAGTHVLASAGQAEHAARAIGGAPLSVIHLRSMQEVLAGQQRPSFPVLILVVSRSPSFRAWASTLLSSLGFEADSVLLRDPSKRGWKAGLAACHIVAADLVAAAEVPKPTRPVVVRLVSEASAGEVRRLLSERNEPESA